MSRYATVAMLEKMGCTVIETKNGIFSVIKESVNFEHNGTIKNALIDFVNQSIAGTGYKFSHTERGIISITKPQNQGYYLIRGAQCDFADLSILEMIKREITR